MDTGELWTRWTVRVAMGLYAVSLTLRILSPGQRGFDGSRVAWTAGCLAYLLHVACAFEVYHHWSHAEAYEATARRSAEVVGLSMGAGLYANYAFTLVWIADVCWWWLNPSAYRARPRAVEWLVQAFMGFMAFNATVVFGAGFIRWAGSAACAALAVVWIVRWSRSRRAEWAIRESP